MPELRAGPFAILAEDLDHPEGVAWSPDGVLFAGGEAGQIYEVTLDGDVRQVATTSGSLLGLALDGDGRIYACDCDRCEVVRVDLRTGAAERYSSLLSPIPSILVPDEPDYAVRTWQSYPIRLGAGAPVGAEELMRQLMADGIATRRGIMAIHLEGAYAEAAVELPHTEAAARDVVLLPLFPGLTEEAQDHVISRLGHYGLAEAA